MKPLGSLILPNTDDELDGLVLLLRGMEEEEEEEDGLRELHAGG